MLVPRKRNVERTGLSLPHLLHHQGAAVILATNSAAALKASALAVLWRGHDEDQVVDPSCNVDWLRQASEEARNGANEAAERAACGLLTKLTSREPENETVNHNPAQALVATPLTCGRSAPIDQRVDPGHLVGLARTPRRDDGPSDRAKLAAAPGPERQVVGVGNVDREVEVALVQRAAELRCGGIRNPPVGLELVSKAGVRYEPVEGRCTLGDSTTRLKQNGHAVVPGHIQ